MCANIINQFVCKLIATHQSYPISAIMSATTASSDESKYQHKHKRTKPELHILANESELSKTSAQLITQLYAHMYICTLMLIYISFIYSLLRNSVLVC